MWRKRPRPSPEDLVIPDDTDLAVSVREDARRELRKMLRQEPAIRKMTDIIIDRQGRNHYIELLYQHVVPRGN